MPSFDLSAVGPLHQATATWAASLLHALARAEHAGRMPVRLTEPGLPTWERFRGRLESPDLLALLFEDAAVLHPSPFDAATLDSTLRLQRLPVSLVDGWLAGLGQLPRDAASADYVIEQARRLGIPSRLARHELHVVKAHHKVLELPGTGGQLAFHLVSQHPELTLQDNFVIGCNGWKERTLAGIIALELGAPRSDFAIPVETDTLRDPEHPLRARSFDFVIGLHPDKGGLYRVEDQLGIWFHGATIVLV